LLIGGFITMDYDPLLVKIDQPPLFELGDSAAGTTELFPAVWNAIEALISPEVSVRRAGILQITQLDAARLSSVVVYLIATRITDPDLEVRGSVITTLGSVLNPGSGHPAATLAVRQQLVTYLSQIHTREVFALLQAADDNHSLRDQIACLFNSCPYAGNHLVFILSDRKNAMAIRKQAAFFLGKVGYQDAIPSLERIEARLAARTSGQQAMPFAPPDREDETSLLAPIQEALRALLAP
jgi:HEAT repeat protein